MYAKIIISERYLNNEMKTVRGLFFCLVSNMFVD